MSGQLYDERFARIETAAHLGIPDRVPVVLNMGAYTAGSRGLKTSEFLQGGPRAWEAVADAAGELGVDGVLFANVQSPVVMAAAVWVNKILMPGRQLGEYEWFQINETSPSMTPDDYDFIIENGWNKFLPRLIPRVVDFMPQEEVFPALEKAAEDDARAAEAFKERGIVTFCGGAIVHPFEMFSGGRTIGEFFKDIYRRPQKVIDAMEAALPDLIETSIRLTRASGIHRVFGGGTRGNSKFISLPKFEKFFWPYMEKIVTAHVEAGLEVMLHLDHDWTGNLEYFRRLPAGMVSMHLDGFTDIFRAKEVLRGRIVIKGDVHPTMLSLGTPGEVDAYCARLIAEVGAGGGFILAQGCDVPINARPENVKAMVAAAHKYGVYNNH